jgi:iron(III) transport system permease protein
LPTWLRRLNPAALACGMGLIALFIYPILRFLLVPVFPSLAPMEGGSGGVIGDISTTAMVNSLELAVASATIAVPCGILMGWIVERRHWWGGSILSAVVWALFFTPSYILTTGWQILFSLPLLHATVLARLFFGVPGIISLLALKVLPFAYLAARASWRAIGGEIDDALRVHVAAPRRRMRILAGLLLPAAGSAWIVGFIESLQEFGIPATLGAQIHLPIITYAIYQRLAAVPLDFSGAALLSWSLILPAGIGAALNLYFLTRALGMIVHGRNRPGLRPRPGVAGQLAFGGMLVLLAAFGLGIPGAMVLTRALAPGSASIPETGWASLGYSCIYAGIAALLATGIATAVLTRVTRRSASRRVAIGMEIFSLTNMAVPGLVLGAAYVIAFNNAYFPLYGTPILLILAYVAAQLPMLLRFLHAPLGQVHHGLADAARLHGMPWAERLVQIHTPMLLTPFLWGWTMAFGQIFFELPVSELLYPAGKEPVAVTLVTLNQQFNYNAESRFALIGIALCLCIAGVVAATARRWTALRMASQTP